MLFKSKLLTWSFPLFMIFDHKYSRSNTSNIYTHFFTPYMDLTEPFPALPFFLSLWIMR